jgi:hypothetical protein
MGRCRRGEGCDGEAGAGQQDQALQAGEGFGGAVGVDRAERTGVAGVEGLEEIEALGPPDLAHHDAVRSHAQGIADEVADAHAADVLGIGRASLQPDDVVAGQGQLGHVLDGDDALATWDQCGQGVEQGRLACPGATGDHEVEPTVDRLDQELVDAGRAHIAQRHDRHGEPTDAHVRPVDGERWKGDVHA